MLVSAACTPALERFIETFPGDIELAQVSIARTPKGFEIRQVADRDLPADDLEPVRVEDLRKVAQADATGAFRPLKSAPTLRTGWRCMVGNPADLEQALGRLYPGALADWLAAQNAVPPVTSYRDFTERQTGMYRTTRKLSDGEVVEVIGACCAANSCLKRRLWSVGGFPTDASEAKSLIPCLEPCAVLLEAARVLAKQKQLKEIDS